MSAFKAANPDAVFEDFIRWHSPGDWESEVNDAASYEKIDESPKSEWPPKGKLSERMSEYGNSWHQMWNDVPALAASEQKPILDPNREGEKVQSDASTVLCTVNTKISSFILLCLTRL